MLTRAICDPRSRSYSQHDSWQTFAIAVNGSLRFIIHWNKTQLYQLSGKFYHLFVVYDVLSDLCVPRLRVHGYWLLYWTLYDFIASLWTVIEMLYYKTIKTRKEELYPIVLYIYFIKNHGSIHVYFSVDSE